MDHYHDSKKARRIAAIVYIIFMLFILGGTYISEQQKAQTQPKAPNQSSH